MNGADSTYRQLLDRIYALGRFGMTPGLERISPLLHALGDPQDAYVTVHVAGTNGKGSTACFLAAILRAGGLRTGLFTSPHLVSFTERFQVNGTEIDEERLAVLAEKVLAAAPPATTFFEVATALACLYFAEAGVRVAVLEVGLGGRFDATNAVDGSLAIITPVSLDHCEYLGTTVAKIAAEKGGIIRSGRPLVLASQEPAALRVLQGLADTAGAPVVVQNRDFAAEWTKDNSLTYRGLDLHLQGLRPGIGGRYQAGNVACALVGAELLQQEGLPLPPSALIKGIALARWPGRMELFPGIPRLLLDGAHNPAGAQALATELATLVYNRLILVVGIMGDKDGAGILVPLLPLATVVVAVAATLDRALSAGELATQIQSAGLPCRVGGTVADGLSMARELAGPDDLVVVCGSLFVVGEARAMVTGQRYEPIRG